MKTTSSIISLKKVYKEYLLGDETVFTALKDINLDIYQGEFSAIVGPDPESRL